MITMEEIEKQLLALRADLDCLKAGLDKKDDEVGQLRSRALRIISRMAQDLAENESISEGILTDIAEEALK